MLVVMVTSFAVLAFKAGWEAHKHRPDPLVHLDGMFIGTNGIVWMVDYGSARGEMAEATDVQVRTIRGRVLTWTIEHPLLAKEATK